MKCCYCHEKLNEEELLNPKYDEDHNKVCDDCFESEIAVYCPLCEDRHHPDVFNNSFIILKNNVFKVVKNPFFLSDGFSGSIFKNSIKFHGKLDGEYENSLEICNYCIENQKLNTLTEKEFINALKINSINELKKGDKVIIHDWTAFVKCYRIVIIDEVTDYLSFENLDGSKLGYGFSNLDRVRKVV